jgi:O-antigen ligase
MSNLPGFLQANVEGIRSQMGFLRASFAFFGANPAALICALSLPMVVLFPKFYKTKFAFFLSMILAAILLIGIYISGSRVAWIMLFITSILLAYFSFRITGAVLITTFWVIVSSFFSDQVWKLILSVYTPATTGQFLDTSMEKRYFRQQEAFDLALQNPLGVGWTGSGWVHGDFAQVAANLGLIAGAIFIIWYLATLYRAWRIYRKYPKDWLLQSILTSFVLAGIVLATEGVQVLSQFVMPVWFVWGLMEAYIQKKSSDEANSDTQPVNRAGKKTSVVTRRNKDFSRFKRI